MRQALIRQLMEKKTYRSWIQADPKERQKMLQLSWSRKGFRSEDIRESIKSEVGKSSEQLNVIKSL